MVSLFPLYFSVYMSMSASLYHYHLSLHPFGILWVYFSLWCFLLTFLLIFYISWNCSLSPGFFFQLSLLFQPGERLGELLIHCFISDKQCDHSQFTSLLHFKFFPCKRGQESPFYILPWASMRRIQWDGNSNASGCHVETSYLSGTLYPSLHLSPRYPIWRVWIITFHHFTEGETETPHGHMAYPTLQNRIFIQTYLFAMVYA